MNKTEIEKTNGGKAVSESWLAEKASEVRFNLGQAAYNMYVAGCALREVKEALPHGQFMNWIEDNFPFGDSTAREFIRASTWMDKYISPAAIPQLVAPKSVITELAKAATPGAVKREMAARLEQGQRLTVDMIRGAAKSAVRSEERLDTLLSVESDRIVELAHRYDLDAKTILVLSDIEYSLPEVFDEIEASGCVWDKEGEPILLHEANSRDITAYVDHTRFERQMQHFAKQDTTTIVLPDYRALTNRQVYAVSGLQHKQIFATVADSFKEIIGDEEVLTYSSPVEIAMRFRFRNRPLRSTDVCTRVYEEALVSVGILQGSSHIHVHGVKVTCRLGATDKGEIIVYPKEEERGWG